MEKVAVIGAGAMGHGIAQLAPMAGLDVTLVDISDEILQRALEKIKWSLEKFAEKKKLSEDVDTILLRIRASKDIADAVRGASFIIEAVPEKLDLKKEVFTEIGRAAPKDAIIASNTSSLSITEMSEVIEKPERFVGMHFFNPPQLMPLVEVIKGAHTSDDTVNLTIELARKLGKTPVLCRKDVKGFIVNRIWGQVFNEACWAIYRGEAKVEEVDSAAKFRMGWPMGVFELLDFAGLDVAHEVGKVMGEAYGGRAKPCPLIGEFVKEGKLGQKTGKGFYDGWPSRPRIPFALADKFDYKRLYAVAVNEAAWLVREGVADPGDIDKAIKLGLAWALGPCEIADRDGIDSILNKLKELFDKHGEEMYRPCPLLEEYVSKGWMGKRSGRGFYEYA